MPIKLNVGAARKVSDQRFSSRGASVNLEVELESALVSDPQKLHERIRHLFDLVHHSLAVELDTHRAPPSGNSSNGKHSDRPRLATPRQVKALHAIAKQRELDLAEVIRERYGLERPEEFTIQQASDLITALRSAES